MLQPFLKRDESYTTSDKGATSVAHQHHATAGALLLKCFQELQQILLRLCACLYVGISRCGMIVCVCGQKCQMLKFGEINKLSAKKINKNDRK